MEQDTARKFDNYDSVSNSSNERYNAAYKRVKRIKGFYIHLLVYVLVNASILISIYNNSSEGFAVFVKWENWSTALFWGIGIVAHGLSVFGKNLFFSSDWEEKKMKEFMEEDKGTKWE